MGSQSGFFRFLVDPDCTFLSGLKKINIITPHFSPEITAAAHRMEAFVQVLEEEYEIRVFTLTERGKRSAAEEVQVSDNTTLFYTYLPKYPKGNFLLRAIFELYYSVKLTRRSVKHPADLTLVTSPFMFLIPVVALFVKKGKKLLDIRDLVWSYLPSKNRIQKFVKNSFRKIIVAKLRDYDRITVTNRAERNWLLKYTSVTPGKISLISNGIAHKRFTHIRNLHYHLPAKPFCISYIGNIGNGQNLEVLMRAVQDLKDIRLNLIGDGIELERLKKLARQHSWTQIHFYGKLSWNRILPFYQSSTLLYAGLSPNYKSAIPSKLFEYYSTGLPVLYQGGGAAGEFCAQFDNSYLVAGSSEEMLRDQLKKIQNATSGLSAFNPLLIRKKYIRENINRDLLKCCFDLMYQDENQLDINLQLESEELQKLA